MLNSQFSSEGARIAMCGAMLEKVAPSDENWELGNWSDWPHVPDNMRGGIDPFCRFSAPRNRRRFESCHFLIQADSSRDDTHRDGGARSFAQTHVQIENRSSTEV